MQNPIDMSSPVRKLFFIPVVTLLLLSGVSTVKAQSLFTIDGSGTSKEEFLKAYNKNNNGNKASDKSYRDYLELYIRYKLKVRAAYDTQLDTLAGQRSELQNFRSQVAETYLKDEISLDRLVKEAFARGQKDIRVSHIFIALPKNPSVTDTLRAYEKAMAAYNELKRGKKFSETALAYSEDPSVKSNQGNLAISRYSPYPMYWRPWLIQRRPVSSPCLIAAKGGIIFLRTRGKEKRLAG